MQSNAAYNSAGRLAVAELRASLKLRRRSQVGAGAGIIGGARRPTQVSLERKQGGGGARRRERESLQRNLRQIAIQTRCEVCRRAHPILIAYFAERHRQTRGKKEEANEEELKRRLCRRLSQITAASKLRALQVATADGRAARKNDPLSAPGWASESVSRPSSYVTRRGSSSASSSCSLFANLQVPFERDLTLTAPVSLNGAAVAATDRLRAA